MATEWTEERLQRYIDDQTQEDLNLDYKGAGALARSDGKKREIHKDVSAMANSAGGILIYGIREYDDSARRHLPERFDPVDQSVFTREWLEQVISGIQPRVQNVVITPVPVGSKPNDAIFVIEIPASSTAHQSSDHKYYKRYNFESVPMNDYEVRDVMNRSTHALIDLEFKLEFEWRTVNKTTMENVQEESVGLYPSLSLPRSVTRAHEERHAFLNVFAKNNGATYAQYVVAYLYMPIKLAGRDNGDRLEDGRNKIRIDNSKNDYIGQRPVYARNVPILPGTQEELGFISLNFNYAVNEHEVAEIEWEVYADNAQVQRGKVQLSNLQAESQTRYTTEERGPFGS